MMISLERHFWFGISRLALFVPLLLVGCGDDPVKPGNPPNITRFTATPGDIMPTDSSLLEYTVTGADSVKLQPEGIKLTPPSTGSHWVKPSRPTLYSLLGYNKNGRDSAAAAVTMSGAVPNITLLDLESDTVLIGDSTALLWRVVRADSIVINNGLGKMADADSGGVFVKPSITTNYRAIAYNQIGNDTAFETARVEIPYAVNAPFGAYYKGVMGGGIQTPEFRFRVLDQAGTALRKPWLYFDIIQGDGTLTADSVRPDANGSIVNDYQFTGQLGHGIVRAMVPGIDTVFLTVRASVIRFGADGQGQYVKLYDAYTDVFGLNGQPVSIDPDPRPGYKLNYVDYENTLGVVAVVFDLDDDNVVQNTEPVVSMILTTLFTGVTTPEGVGIGSSIHAVRAAYGQPDNFFFDPTDPPAWGMEYDSLGALFYASTTPPDSAIIELHLTDPTPPAPTSPPVKAALGLTRAPYSERWTTLRR
ncbi:MAG: hypothetical protein AB1772_04185 [Candidatus Zixiibacteriota bacterium]